MLSLLEPYNTDCILDRPDLGCAMLIAACQEKGFKTTLIKGQTRCIRDMFVRDSEELWNLICDLDHEALKEIGISEFGEVVQNTDLRQFQKELDKSYQEVFVDKSPRNYLNAIAIDRLNRAYSLFSKVYIFYLVKRNHAKLRIISNYLREVIESKPRFIGVSLHGNFGPLSRIIRKRLKEETGLPIIIGGALTPFINLKKLDRIFEEEYFDYLIIGPGEKSLPALLESLHDKANISKVPNVIYKENGKVVINRHEEIGDLDQLPFPDYSQFDLDLYLTPKRILPLQTARGCTWRKCAFCSHHNIYHGKYKALSCGRVLNVMRHLKTVYQCHHFAFHDEELPAGRAGQISKEILRIGLNDVHVNIYARPTSAYNGSLLALMRRAGISMVHWGVESGSQKILDLMCKGTKLSEVSHVLRNSSHHKIANLCFFIFGFPGESKKDALQTVRFLKTHAAFIDNLSFGPFALDRYSPIGKNPNHWCASSDFETSAVNQEIQISSRNKMFWSKFIADFRSNNIKVTSDKLTYLPESTNRRMLCFMVSSHGLIPYKQVERIIAERRLGSIFPIILGIVKNEEGTGCFFYPTCAIETSFINEKCPPRRIRVDEVRKRIVLLSEGILSVSEIYQILRNVFMSKYSDSVLYRICFGFFQRLFQKKYALAFERSWDSKNSSS